MSIRRYTGPLVRGIAADVSLDLIGSRDSLIIDEAELSQSVAFTRMLATLRPDTRVYIDNGEHGVARGALRLLDRLPPTRSPFNRWSGCRST